MALNRGWVPRQHGVWAIVAVPYLVGLILARRVRPLTLADAMLGLTWLAGYFAFNAAGLLVKTGKGRRGGLLAPLLSYGSLCAVTGTVALLVDGWHLVTWVPLYAIALPWALWLTAHKQERSILSGVLTVGASCALMLVLRFENPAELFSPTGFVLQDLSTICLVTGYFIGTVLHIKAMIRERNNPLAHRRSIIYHGALAGSGISLVTASLISWPWLIWLVALLVRTIYLPGLARKKNLRPLHLGLVEIALSLGVLVAVWL